MLAILMLALAGIVQAGATSASMQASAPRILSLDLCADQYVLALVPPDQIVAVSTEAGKDFSYFRERAKAHRVVRPRLEAVLAARPDLVVRSYGGGRDLAEALERLGVPVIQLGWINGLDGIGPELTRVANALGETENGQALRADFETRLAGLRARSSGPRALYTTPGGVTTGPGTLIHAMMEASGLTNAATRTGWHDLPLEAVLTKPPDRFVTAFDDSQTHMIHHWSAMRHGRLHALMAATDRRSLDGALTACGAWYAIEAMEAMAAR
jgi:iron complex transport system substrate-binding protein